MPETVIKSIMFILKFDGIPILSCTAEILSPLNTNPHPFSPPQQSPLYSLSLWIWQFWEPWAKPYSICPFMSGLFFSLYMSFFKKKCFGAQLIYDIMLVSGIQQSESVIHIHVATFFRLFSHLGRYRVEFPVLYSRSLLVLYFAWIISLWAECPQVPSVLQRGSDFHPFEGWIIFCCEYILGFLVGLMVENQPAMQETWVWSLGQEDPLEKEMTIHSSFLAWTIPWTEKPGGLQCMGLQRVRYDLAIKQ